MAAYSVLEQLPFPAVKVIARYCSPQDIAVCCAVSSQMRDIYGESILWRRHCTSGLAEYLRSTPCKVQPAFVSPEPENSTLSPISSARLDFMLENHLWNNWRLGRNVRQEETHFRFSIWDKFLTNDHLMSHMYSPERIEIFDVRKSPLQKLATFVSPNKIYDTDSIHISNNRVCLIKNQCVEVHQINLIDTQQSPLCSVEHVFFCFNEVKNEHPNYSLPISAGDEGTTLLIGSLVVAIKKRDATLHIWNIETGCKLKMQECPLPCVFENVLVAHMKLVLKVTNNLQTANRICTILVYDLSTLSYQDFKLNVNRRFEYYVCGRFLAILSKKLLNVFDYNTSETVMSDVHVNSPMLACFQNGFLFIGKKKIEACDPVLRQIVTLPINLKAYTFQIMSDRILNVGTRHNELIFWEFQSLRKARRIRTKMDWGSVKPYYLNRASTRYIDDSGSRKILVHFW